MNFITLAEIPTEPNSQPLVKPDTLFDGLLIAIPVLISVGAFAMRELIQLEVKRKSEEYSSEIETQKLEQEQARKRVEYLEKQNEILLQEILSLRRMMEVSGPLSLSMYKPTNLNTQHNAANKDKTEI